MLQRDCSDEVIRHGFVQRELQGAFAVLECCELGAEFTVAFGNRVHTHVMLPAGEVDHILAVDPKSRNVVGDDLGRAGQGRCDRRAHGLQYLLHRSGERGDVRVDGFVAFSHSARVTARVGRSRVL